jgi:hypothetical protein
MPDRLAPTKISEAYSKSTSPVKRLRTLIDIAFLLDEVSDAKGETPDEGKEERHRVGVVVHVDLQGING